MQTISTETIVASATPPGKGALGIIRVSGENAISIVNSIWKGTDLNNALTHTVHLGYIENENGEPLDQALATIFRNPKSFTGEDSVELSLHGSPWIMREVINLLLRKGCRGAEPGEFTRRAFLNGRMDLASAEGVADLIASSSRAAHRLAMQQTRGVFSREFNHLRDQLIRLASLLELELDFSEEDVEFADRSQLLSITTRLIDKIDHLTQSYSAGRAFKNGVPVVIAGLPNVGKSTLLNAILEEDKAIVSEIPGTTRDIIEDTIEIEGILFRFIDTAGIRESDDTIETLGIERARQRLSKASIVLWLIDSTAPLHPQIKELQESTATFSKEAHKIILLSKCSLSGNNTIEEISRTLGNELPPPILLSAAEGIGISDLKQALKAAATSNYNPESELLLTNSRHYSDLLRANEALKRAKNQMASGQSGDFIAMDIREAISALASLTGDITAPDLLNSIFSSFCIGK